MSSALQELDLRITTAHRLIGDVCYQLHKRRRLNMNTITRKTISVLTSGILMLALIGCQKEGPAEKAGKEIDKAVSSAGDQIQAAGDKIQSAVK